ncbi:MAG: hypothetical protein QMC03_02805 [Flavobacteriales bacterium]|jgi:hypothetical protein|tara:strand:+ start:3552 stop:3830 length:279 start_codon:yes stop_codon:yes gene_type:complete
MDKLKDNVLLGIALGVLIPMVSYALILSLLDLTLDVNPLRVSTMQVIAIFINFPIFRIILTKHKKDKLGRGMLLSTFVLAAWYIIHHNMLEF